ncbi:uncharacterized protein N7515_006053 [Penicillium bovifimosum]|uniref:Uncharacterized protein n=1 Tax=Penicillium bovifimosum TaxID=126998 RepID=A0A9W9GVJ7_9EURO|nr:uncharacterized protein N7515_006053 [Penicillium bovifimosum]KAJ5130014.1 hypothetical protein N7515_006053 [Penicillium bovifimosum]
MAGGITAVQSRTKHQETISFPIMTYTDELPRNGLDTVNDASQHPSEPAMIGQWDFSQPPAGDGWIRKPPPGQGATFDFRLTAPPDEAIQPSHPRTPAEQHMIGIALGSPSMVQKEETLPPPRFNVSILETEKDLARKPSKWKKIGGLFKTKNAFTSLPVVAQESNLKSQSNERSRPRKQPKSRESIDSTEEWPRLEIDPPQMRGHRYRNDSLSGSKASKDQTSTQGLMLSVDIPNIQMERYSVLFSNVVNKTERPSLLARRAKTLDKLCVPEPNNFLKSPARPVPQRRATSPARTSFTLFPNSHSSKAAQILGTQNFSRGPRPLARANTLPIDSPSSVPPKQAQQAAAAHNVSSFESPVIPKVFIDRTSTPRSSSSYDKPLPPIKPEQPARQHQRVPQQTNNPSPQKVRPQQSAQAQKIVTAKPATHPRNPPLQPRTDSLPRTTETKPHGPFLIKNTSHHQPNQRPDHPKVSHAVRAGLTVDTRNKPKPPAKDTPPTSASPSPPSKIYPTQDNIDQITSPLSAFTDPTSGVSPSDSIQELSPTPTHLIPKIEVSTARSISVSRATRQMLVPIGGRIDYLDSQERLVQRRPLVPMVVDAQRGHRPGVSQELRIECL